MIFVIFVPLLYFAPIAPRDQIRSWKADQLQLEQGGGFNDRSAPLQNQLSIPALNKKEKNLAFKA